MQSRGPAFRLFGLAHTRFRSEGHVPAFPSSFTASHLATGYAFECEHGRRGRKDGAEAEGRGVQDRLVQMLGRRRRRSGPKARGRRYRSCHQHRSIRCWGSIAPKSIHGLARAASWRSVLAPSLRSSVERRRTPVPEITRTALEPCARRKLLICNWKGGRPRSLNCLFARFITSVLSWTRGQCSVSTPSARSRSRSAMNGKTASLFA